MSEYWQNRHAEVCHAVDGEWDALDMKLSDDWLAAYKAEFTRYALERNWTLEDINSGWLDEMPDNAMSAYGCDSNPEESARIDVKECELESN